MRRKLVRAILGVVAFACAFFAFWIYDSFPNGGNGSASQRAAALLEWSVGIGIAAFAALLLTFRWSGRPPATG